MAKYATKKNCLNARPIPEYQILMAQLDTDQDIVKYSPEMGPIHTVFLHAITKELKSSSERQFSALSTIYFMKSDRYPGYYHILKWYPTINAFGCSCLDGKRHIKCDHQKALEAQTSVVAA